MSLRARLQRSRSIGLGNSQSDEDPEVAAWNEKERDKQFFHQVYIAEDGGFSDVGELFNKSRYVYALLAIVVIGMSINTLYSQNTQILRQHFAAKPMGVVNTTATTTTTPFTLTTRVLPIVNPTVLVAGYELFLLIQTLVAGFYFFLEIIFFSDKPWRRWKAVGDFFWQFLGRLPSTSAMRMLYYVTPAVLVADLSNRISTKKPWKDLVGFVLWRCLIGVIGVDAFLLKLQLNAGEAVRGDISIINTLVFLNQLLGIVQIKLFAQQRILEFIFAGEDGVMEPEEQQSMETWHAMLAQQLWNQTNNFFEFAAVMLTYSDYDFQKLALEPATLHEDQAAHVAEQPVLPTGESGGVLS